MWRLVQIEYRGAPEKRIRTMERVYIYSDNPNITQTLEYTKDKYNAKIIKRKSLLRSHQQPTKAEG
jgi:hypothetical protein